MSAAKAEPTPPEVPSLAAQLTEFLSSWLDAQNRRSVGALRKLYMPCFDGPAANRSADEPAWIQEHGLWGEHWQRVTLVKKRPDFVLEYSSPSKSDPSIEPTQAWLRLIVRREMQKGGRIVSTKLHIGWLKGQPVILEQQDQVLSKWNEGEIWGLVDLSVSPAVHIECSLCGSEERHSINGILRECERQCETAESDDQKRTCWLIARTSFLGLCGAPKDLPRAWKYWARAGGNTYGDDKEIFAVQLLTQNPDDIQAAVRLVDCIPDHDAVLKEHCKSIWFVNKYLLESNNKKWMEKALENFEKKCPPASQANPCGSDDYYCKMAIDILMSKKLGPPPPGRIERYRDSIEKRRQGGTEECSDD